MKPYLWALLAAFCWGFVPIIEKLGLAKMPVWAGVFYRCLGVSLGLVFLTVLNYSEIKKAVLEVPSGWYYVMIGGFLASVVGQILFYNALKTGEASKVVPVGAAYPLISFFLGIIIFKESFTLAKLAGLFFIVLGVILLK